VYGQERSNMMVSRLVLRQYVDLPSGPAGDFDHGDVFLANGRVFIANTYEESEVS